jgi:PKD repeat protein
MNPISYKKIAFHFLLWAGQIFTLPAFAQEFCDFWGTAYYLDRTVISGDVVDAYDASGNYLARAYAVANGYYSIHVPGDDPSTAVKDGAIANELILFKINQDSALVVSGDNRWIKGVRRCDLLVPMGPARAKPGGPYYGSEGSMIAFDGSLSVGIVSSFAWNFGDGSTGTGVRPSHTYKDDGIYTVTLTVFNDSGDDDTKSTTATVSNIAPVVQAGNDKTANEGASVQFNGSVFDPGVLDVHVYSWNFGDGRTGAGKDISHVYRDNGSFKAKLTVNDGGANGIDSLTVFVANLPPAADAGGPYYGIVQQPVQFSGKATDPGTDDTFDYDWDLDGDGQYDDSDEQNPQKTYMSTGTYAVYLRVTDDDLAQDTSKAFVHIEQGIAVTFQSQPKTGFQMIVGNQTYTTPVTLYLMPDSLYTVEAPEVQSGSTGIRYNFNYWSDGKTRIHAITGPSAQTTYTAYYQTQYCVEIDDGNIGTNVTGEGWYQSGARVSIGIDASVVDSLGTTRHLFQGWVGFGKNSYTGKNNPASFYISDEPVTEKVQWKNQYYLALDSPQNRGNPQLSSWYDERSWVTFTIDTVVQAGSGDRFVFDRWSSSDQYGYNGTESSPGFLMLGPVIEEALWNRQFAFSAQSDPVGGGTVVPSQGWANQNESVLLTAVGNGGSNSIFSHWTGSASGSANPLTLMMSESREVIGHFIEGQGNVTINSSPEGLSVMANSTVYIAPVMFDWAPNSTKTLGTDESQGDSGTGTIQIFNHWSDGGARVHNVTVPNNPVTYTAYFQTSHFLDIVSEYGSPSGEGWYIENSTATISVDSLVEISSQVRQRFNGWIGTGAGSVTSNDRTVQIDVEGPIKEQVQWLPQFSLQTGYTPSHVSVIQIQKTPPGPWYDLGTQVQLTASSSDPNYTFVGWSGDVINTNPTIQVVVNGSKELVANFYTPQRPPVVENMPDVILMEDEVFERSFEWLAGYVSDPSDPLKLLNFSFEGAPHIQGELDTLNEKYRIIPASNWWGVENAILKVTDPYELSDADTFQITVMPLDDPPGSFELLSPPDSADYPATEWSIEFVWESSENVDLNDSISYNFYLSRDKQFLNPVVVIESRKGTSLILNTPAAGSYWWRVIAKDAKPPLDDGVKCDRDFQIIIVSSGIESDENNLPKTYGLSQNFPNPFNPETVIQYQLPKPGTVRLSVYDLCGRCVRTLVNEKMHAGYHQIVWDGKDLNGKYVASGMYFFDIDVNGFISKKKMILLR